VTRNVTQYSYFINKKNNYFGNVNMRAAALSICGLDTTVPRGWSKSSFCMSYAYVHVYNVIAPVFNCDLKSYIVVFAQHKGFMKSSCFESLISLLLFKPFAVLLISYNTKHSRAIRGISLTLMSNLRVSSHSQLPSELTIISLVFWLSQRDFPPWKRPACNPIYMYKRNKEQKLHKSQIILF